LHYGARVLVRRVVKHAALHAPVPCEGRFVRRAVRRFMEHAYWHAVLLGMLHRMPLRPKEGRLCTVRGAPLNGVRALLRRVVRHDALHAPAPQGGAACIMGHAYWYAVLISMLHCMPLRPEEGRL
jgi:hypothetical protein